MGFDSNVYGRQLVDHGINYEDGYSQSGYMLPNVPYYGTWGQKWSPTVNSELFYHDESFTQYPYVLIQSEYLVIPSMALSDGQDPTLPNRENQAQRTPETPCLPAQNFRID